ncbi:MAG: chemotaxis protein CheW [Desulfomonile tiedjei]|nr:chemotaxis protein CheW [Desulfomonile tiedjei]
MIDTEILQDYSSEARELLDEMDHSLLRLEKEGRSPEILNNIFRAVHCIKGSAEYIGLERSSTLTHGVENLLDRLREGLITLDARIVDFLFRVKDMIATLIHEVSESHKEKTEISALMVELEGFLQPTGSPPEAPPGTESVERTTETLPGQEPPSDSQAPPSDVTEELGGGSAVPAEDAPDQPYVQVASELDGHPDYSAVSQEGSEDFAGQAVSENSSPAGQSASSGEEILGEQSASTSELSGEKESTAEHVATLEQTVPHILNISLYLDDLQDGLNPQEIITPISEALQNLIDTMRLLGRPKAVDLLQTLEKQIGSIRSDQELLSVEEVNKLRGLLHSLKEHYPEEVFPLSSGMMPEADIAPPENPIPTGVQEDLPLVRELADVPEADETAIRALVRFGFSSRAQLARADLKSLRNIPEISPSLAEAILRAVGVVPEPTTTRRIFPKGGERSMLADVDDELLQEFEGIFADGNPLEISGLARPRSDVADMLGELDTLGQDADREIMEIFLAYGWEIVDKLRQVAGRIKPGSVERSDLETCADLIKSIRSSSSYMDFQSLAAFLDEWYDETTAAVENAESLTAADLRFMEANRTRFEDFLAGLDGVLSPEAAANGAGAGPEDVTLAMSTSEYLPTLDVDQAEVPPASASQVGPSEFSDELLRPVEPTRTADRAPQRGSVPTEESTTERIQREAAPEPSPVPTGELAPPPMLGDRVAGEMAVPRDLSQEGAMVRTMRVDSGKVDVLLNQVGELVVNRSYVEQLSLDLKTFHRDLLNVTELGKKDLQTIKDFSLKVGEASLSLGRIANDIQEGVMKLRMLPIGQLFNRMPRLIRDLSRRVGKVVALEVRGGDTEVDKRVIEQIYNPLVHLIRNAVDHGIEDKAIRKQSGKKEEGTISLSAYSQGNQVVIDVEDDGAGINSKAILEKAVESRLIEAQDTKGLTPQDLQNFLFIPGFSTSKRVTRTSGRGVGMDVVKKDVEKINGHVEIESEEGQGTRISIRIPLTLAIIQTLLIRVDKHVFAIPLTSVREILQVSPSDITTIEGFEVIKFRDETIPILRVDQVFNLKDYDKNKQPRFLVLAMFGMKTVGLLVEELIGEQDVVIKPLAEHVCESRGLAGSTILGDGTIALVLDVTEMVEDIINRQRQLAASGARFFQPSRLAALNNHADL